MKRIARLSLAALLLATLSMAITGALYEASLGGLMGDVFRGAAVSSRSGQSV